MARLVSLLSQLTTSVHRITTRIQSNARILSDHMHRSFMDDDDAQDFLAFELAASPAETPAIPTDSLVERTKELLDDIFGTLFAVPKKRLTLNRRHRRRAAAVKWAPFGGLKQIPQKKDIVACQTCGHYHELRFLCDKCYERVKQASKPIQDAMVKAFAGQPVDQDVAVRYRGETEETEPDVRIVEIDDQRPEWFSQNLMSKTHRTQLPAEPTESLKSKS